MEKVCNVRENPNNIWFSAHLIVPLQPKETNKIITTMGISVDSIWSQAQRLSASDRLALSRRLRESVNETEVERRERVASEIDRFFVLHLCYYRHRVALWSLRCPRAIPRKGDSQG
jgi:hypothetical protein